jgi:hypothetical protein
VLSHGVYDFENTTTKTYQGEMTEGDAVAFANAMFAAPLVPDQG